MASLGGTNVCTVLGDCEPLYPTLGLYLKPMSRVTISIAIPHMDHPIDKPGGSGKIVSNWEIMEKLRTFIRPVDFAYLKVVKSTSEYMRYEGEFEDSTVLPAVLERLNGKIIKLSGFTEAFKVRAAEYKQPFPSAADWDTYFKEENSDMPGLRPDTVYLEGLPCKWFTSTHKIKAERYALWKSDQGTFKPKYPSLTQHRARTRSPSPPSWKPNSLSPEEIMARDWQNVKEAEVPEEEVVKGVFETFGAIRNIDIPSLDPHREEGNTGRIGTFSAFAPNSDSYSSGVGGPVSCLTFSAYIQYMDCRGFVAAMDGLRNKKIMYRTVDEQAYATTIKVDFDKNGHLSQGALKKRKIEALARLNREQEKLDEARRKQEEEDRELQEELRQEAEKALEKKKMREEKKRMKHALKQQKEKERLLRKIAEKQREIEELKKEEEAREERKKLIYERNMHSLNLVRSLLKTLKRKKMKEDAERRMKELEKAQLADVDVQKLIVAELAERRKDGSAGKPRIVSTNETDVRQSLVEKYKAILEQEDLKKRQRIRQQVSGNVTESTDLKSKAKISKQPEGTDSEGASDCGRRSKKTKKRRDSDSSDDMRDRTRNKTHKKQRHNSDSSNDMKVRKQNKMHKKQSRSSSRDKSKSRDKLLHRHRKRKHSSSDSSDDSSRPTQDNKVSSSHGRHQRHGSRSKRRRSTRSSSRELAATPAAFPFIDPRTAAELITNQLRGHMQRQQEMMELQLKESLYRRNVRGDERRNFRIGAGDVGSNSGGGMRKGWQQRNVEVGRRLPLRTGGRGNRNNNQSWRAGNRDNNDHFWRGGRDDQQQWRQGRVRNDELNRLNINSSQQPSLDGFIPQSQYTSSGPDLALGSTNVDPESGESSVNHLDSQTPDPTKSILPEGNHSQGVEATNSIENFLKIERTRTVNPPQQQEEEDDDGEPLFPDIRFGSTSRLVHVPASRANVYRGKAHAPPGKSIVHQGFGRNVFRAEDKY